MIPLFTVPFLILSSMWGVTFLDRVPSLSPSPSASIVRAQRVHATSTKWAPNVAPQKATTSQPTVAKKYRTIPMVAPKVSHVMSSTTLNTPPSTPSLTTPSTTPTQDSAQSVATQLEERIAVLMNNARAAQGLPRLTEDTRLSAIARGHSLDMRTHSYFSHTNQSGCSSSCRVSNAGYAWSAIGENIYTLEGYAIDVENIAQKVVDGWMNSAGHRANILGTQFTNQGVGVSLENKTVYVTAVYSKPK